MCDSEISAKTLNPPQEIIDELINLYNEGALVALVDRTIALTSLHPNALVIWNILGAAHQGLGRTTEAFVAFKKVTNLSPDYPEGHNNLGINLQSQGKLEDSIKAFNKAISLKPEFSDAYFNMGISFVKQGKLDEAIMSYQNAVYLEPHNVEAHGGMGNALKDQGRLDEAIASYNKLIKIQPNNPDAYYNIGNVMKDQGDLHGAIKSYKTAIHLNPDFFEAYNGIGIILLDQGDFQGAIEVATRAISLESNFAEAYNTIGIALNSEGELEGAEGAYKKAISLKPDYADAYSNLGLTLGNQSKLQVAIVALQKALALQPDNVGALINMGITLANQGNPEEALTAYKKAINIEPNSSLAYFNMANVLVSQKKPEEAIHCYSKGLSIQPTNDFANAMKLYQQTKICDWASVSAVEDMIPNLGITDQFVEPLTMLHLEDSPERHHLRSKVYAKAKLPKNQGIIVSPPTQKPAKLRIGYFSGDYKAHPVAHLIARVLELHDRNHFEVFGYSLNKPDKSTIGQRVIKSFDKFTNIHIMSDANTINTVLNDKLDIAIDLSGYTNLSRPRLFSHRMAPIQINYLGYPGTMGLDYIDYIIADSVVIPNNQKDHYSEKIIYLPNTYQATDNKRFISNKKILKVDLGLPSEGFIFCCFNNVHKISPTEFNIWMRLLIAVDGSVLWLYSQNDLVKTNLRQEAENRGVAGERLIFAERMPQEDHLARLQLADLFIDTFHYNAHTTCSDAIWAGLPVVTKLGQGFPARVAGSILKSIGLSELVTQSYEEYELLIMTLAKDRNYLKNVKEKLTRNQLSKALFNTELFTKHLETGYSSAYQKYFEGQQPEAIYVANQPTPKPSTPVWLFKLYKFLPNFMR